MRGFTYIGLLFAVALLGILLSVAGLLWDTEARREKEKQLLFAGKEYQNAIASYAARRVNGQRVNQYPESIDDLLEDNRGEVPVPVRHLRRRYVDPITNSPAWGLVRAGGGIVAVYSLSAEKPVKQAGFGPCCERFAKADHYSDWKFGESSSGLPAPGR